VPSLAHRVTLGLSLAVFYVPARVLFGLRCTRRAPLPGRGPVILCANHLSLLDPIVLQAVWWRPVAYLMDAEFYDYRPIRRYVKLCEAIPVEEGGSGVATLRRAGEVLERGDVVGIFPEGGVARDGRLQAFRSGAAVLALRHGATVVPAWIEGTHRALPRDARMIRRARIAVSFGETIPPSAPLPGALDDAVVAAWTRKIRDAVASLAPSRERVGPAR
jgi:1-acyl-sn-glycerol-3-phosphate acyltransferase